LRKGECRKGHGGPPKQGEGKEENLGWKKSLYLTRRRGGRGRKVSGMSGFGNIKSGAGRKDWRSDCLSFKSSE